MNRKLTFLFGAGADSVYNICTGPSFAASLLKNEFYPERKQLLGEDVTNCALIHGRSRRVYLQTIESNVEEANDALGNDIVKSFVSYYNGEDSSKEVKELIDNKCAEWYKSIKEHNKASEFFLKHTVFFDAIDEKFNSLRKIPLNKKAKTVVNTYASIFILMVKALYNIPNDFKWNYKSIVDLLNKPYDKIDFHERSYYTILKDNHIESNIVTTNYTDICETITGNKVVYLHGNLKWFEDYEKLTVYDCSKESERKIIESKKHIFPFILIPSGVKPIICKKELDMFFEFNKALEESTTLCIVGYRFNNEDNHINSLIAEWLRSENHRMVYFNFNNGCELSKFTWLDAEAKNKIEIINIDKDNALDKFEAFIKEN